MIQVDRKAVVLVCALSMIVLLLSLYQQDNLEIENPGQMLLSARVPPTPRLGLFVLTNRGNKEIIFNPSFTFYWTNIDNKPQYQFVISNEKILTLAPGTSRSIMLQLPSEAPIMETSFSYRYTRSLFGRAFQSIFPIEQKLIIQPGPTVTNIHYFQ